MQLFLTAFESVPDPRAENVRHDLVEILLIAFLAVLCSAQHDEFMLKLLSQMR
jgi:DDE_Tnp_1-associated